MVDMWAFGVLMYLLMYGHYPQLGRIIAVAVFRFCLARGYGEGRVGCIWEACPRAV